MSDEQPWHRMTEAARLTDTRRTWWRPCLAAMVLLSCTLPVICRDITAKESENIYGLYANCLLARDLLDKRRKFNNEKHFKSLACMSYLSGVITVMQMNCYAMKDGKIKGDPYFSISPTTLAEGVDAFISWAEEHDEYWGEKVVFLLKALHEKRPCELDEDFGTGASPQGDGGVLTGRTRIVDGDTFDLGQVRVRLWGIDAPEDDQPGGAEAAAELARIIAGREVYCERKGRDHQRVVARCTVSGQDIAAQLVRAGFAMDYPRYSAGAYANRQLFARAVSAGLWRERFIPPWEWRRGVR
jgi:endonuclease YncB( thermonuclease family)